MKTSEALNKAADYIGVHGLNKGDFGSPDGPVCARGAINAVLNGDPDLCFADDEPRSYGAADDASRALIDHLGLDDDTPRVIAIIGDWNDEPTRTAEEVMAAMRACAAELAEAGQ